MAGELQRRARFEDDSPVTQQRKVVSESRETTFDRDISDPAELERILERLVQRLCETLTAQRRSGRTVGIKVRLDDFSTHTRARTLPAPVAAPEHVGPVALDLLRRFAREQTRPAPGSPRRGPRAGRTAHGRAIAPDDVVNTLAFAPPRGVCCRGEPAMTSIANFLRGTDKEFFDLFERAGDNLGRAAQLLDEMLAEYPERRGLARDILGCERDGDQITHEIIRRLNQTFVTPIDREDILQLASALDDIVDYTEEVADYLGLYRIEAPMVQAQRLAGVLRSATHEIALSIPLVRGFKDISEHTVEVHRLENEADRIVREAIASLFEVGIDPIVVIRWKDIFERLENAIDSTERAAYILEGIVIKNS